MSTFESLLIGINAAGLGYLIYLQYKIIASYERVFKSTDIKRLVEYYEKIDELTKKHAMKTALNVADHHLNAFENKIGRQFDEMATFIDGLYKSLPSGEAIKFLDNHFPAAKEMFPYKEGTIVEILRNVRETQDPS